jgi:hypothetical protein
MRHLFVFIFLAVISACGKLGRPDQSEQPPMPVPSGSPSPVDESLYTSVRLGLLNRSINEEVKCSGVRPGIKLVDQTANNGEMAWKDSMLVINRATSNSQHLLRQLWLAFDETSGFYGKVNLSDAEVAAGNHSIRINFGIVTIDEGEEASAVYKRSLLIKGNQIHWLDQNEKEHLIQNASLRVVDNSVLFSVPSEIIEGVVFYPFWYVEASLISNSNLIERTGVRFVESPRTLSNHIKVSECHPVDVEADEPVIQLLSPEKFPDTEVRRQLGVARRAWAQISSEIGQNASPVASVAMMIGRSESGDGLLNLLHNWLNNRDFIIKLHEFDVPNLTTTPQWHRQQEYAFISQVFANIHLLDPSKVNAKNISSWLTLANSVASQDIQRSIGVDAQYRFAWSSLKTFADNSDIEGEKLSLNHLSPELLSSFPKNFSKILGLSEMLATLLSPFDLIGVMNRFGDLLPDEQTLNEAAEIVFQTARKSNPAFPADGFSGWVTPENYNPSWSPQNLVDIDSDGLNGFVETLSNTSPLKGDTDSDGWGDSSEYIQGTGAADSTDHPDMIFADGEFGDWRFLLPNRVSMDPDPSSSSCMGEANITHFSGVHDASRLVVMANQDRETNIDFRWHVFFEFIVDGATLALDAALLPGEVLWRWSKVGDNQPNPIFLNMTPISKKTLELELRLRDILTEQEIEKLQQVRYRVKTSSNGESCDDTQWIKLLKYQQ